MASYTPVELMPPTQLTDTAATVYTPSGATVGIVRTLIANCPNSGHTFSLSVGASAAGTRLWTTYAVTQNVPTIINLWQVIPNGVNVQAFADANSQVVLSLSGLEFG